MFLYLLREVYTVRYVEESEVKYNSHVETDENPAYGVVADGNTESDGYAHMYDTPFSLSIEEQETVYEVV